MQYRVIPFIGKIKSNQTAVEVAGQLQRVINESTVEGWEFEQLTNVNIEVQPGCLAGLFGASADYIRFDMVVLRKSG